MPLISWGDACAAYQNQYDSGLEANVNWKLLCQSNINRMQILLLYFVITYPCRSIERWFGQPLLWIRNTDIVDLQNTVCGEYLNCLCSVEAKIEFCENHWFISEEKLTKHSDDVPIPSKFSSRWWKIDLNLLSVHCPVSPQLILSKFCIFLNKERRGDWGE